MSPSQEPAPHADKSRLRKRPGDQQLPTPNDQPGIHELVISELPGMIQRDKLTADLRARLALGISRYGTPLQAFNSRDALQDLYEELLDALVYSRQVCAEGGASHSVPGAGWVSVWELYFELRRHAALVAQVISEREELASG